MASNRKYTPEEIDYVHARIEAAWNFDIIAKAFKTEFAPHWTNKNFTKKQVQYIKSSYKRAPGTIKPHDGPIPTFPPSPTPSATDFVTMNQKDRHQSAHRDSTNGFMAGASHPPPNAAGENQYTPSSASIVAASNNMFLAPVPRMFAGNLGGDGNLNLNQGNAYTNQLIDPYILDQFRSSQDASITNSSQQQPHGLPSITNVGTQPQQQQFPQSSPSSANTYGACTQGTSTHAVDARYSGYNARLDSDIRVGIPSLQDGLLNLGGTSLGGAGSQHQHQQQQQQPLQPITVVPEDLNNFHFDFGPSPSNPAITDTEHTSSQTQFTGLDLTNTIVDPTQRTPPPECTVDRMVDNDAQGWWYPGAHDTCTISVEHRHDFDGFVGFRNVYAYRYNMDVVVNGLLLPVGLSYDPLENKIILPVLQSVEEEWKWT